jgi:hypothetical protein
VGDNSEGIAGMVWSADLTVATAKVTV